MGPSTVPGTNLCWLKDLMAALREKEMEALRAEVPWPRSPSEKVPGPRSFLLLSLHFQARYPYPDLTETLGNSALMI